MNFIPSKWALFIYLFICVLVFHLKTVFKTDWLVYNGGMTVREMNWNLEESDRSPIQGNIPTVSCSLKEKHTEPYSG
jgi:hypothetical protein